jgi:signal transduction histidine kinase/ligand-binding sensor domain-containing protein
LEKRLCYILFLLFVGLHAMAQDAKQYSFFHHGTSAGLSSNEISMTAQDEDGYIWIASNNGLQRFDGSRYISFRHQKGNPRSIPNNYIQQIVIDKKQNLWLVTADGKLGIFDRKWFEYNEVKVSIPDSNFLVAARGLYTDLEGNVFFSIFNNYFLTYNPGKKEFSEAYNFIPFPKGWKMLDIKQQPGTQKYWITRQDGIAIYNKATGQFSYSGHNTEKEAFIDSLGDIRTPASIHFDKKGRLWFFHWGSGVPFIYSFDLKRGKTLLRDYPVYDLVKTYHEVRGFVEQADGTIWIYGLMMFARFIEEDKKFQLVANGYSSEQSISYVNVMHLFEDREHNIWVSTNNNGLYRFNPAAQFFTNIRHVNRTSNKPGDGSVMSFVRAKDGSLLFGAWGDGTYRFDKNFKMIPLNLRGVNENAGPYAWSLCASRDSNTIWMGAQPGVWIIDQDKRSMQHVNPPVMRNVTVRQIVEDKYGNVWLGTQWLGVFKWNGATPRSDFANNLLHIEGIPNAQIAKLYIDNQGYIWVSASGFGVYRIDPATNKIIAHIDMKNSPWGKLSYHSVSSFLQYDDSTMVITGQDIHFFNMRLNKITRTIEMPTSTPGSTAAMEKDKNGYIWISTTGGLFRLNPQNEIFIHFDRIDGIGNDYFIVASSYALPDGRLVFGSDNQMVVFDPMKVKINDPSPEIRITGFRLANKPLLVDSLLSRNRIELGPNDNSIVIEFSGLQYNGTYIIRYKLEKLDKEWKTADLSNQAVYSYLPPGTYTLLMKSEDAEGHPSSITKVIIKVKPPFWKTWWFLGLVIFAATAILFWLDKLRMQRIRATESIRTRIATSLTEDMSNSLSNINISSELAKTKIDSDTQRTKEYIGQISDTSNRMVQAMYDMVWSIDPKNDTMANTIERMKAFAGETESLFPVNIDFDIDKNVDKLASDMEHRYELLCIYKEAVTNAARHSNGRYVKVSLRYANSRLIMMILDDGRGFTMDEAAMLGRGISDMRRRAAAINATLYIESEINTGTVVKLEMPV